MTPDTPENTKPETAGLLVDLGPLLVFLVTYWLGGVFYATGAFMLATASALLWSRYKIGKISSLLLFSGAMVLIFGGLTILLNDERFIKIKPTLYYAVLSAILFYGVVTKKPTLQSVMQHAYPDLQQHGWHLLTRNFAVFFAFMALANELVWRNNSFEFWLGYKLWGAMPATLLFGIAHVPMILKYSDTPATDDPAP